MINQFDLLVEQERRIDEMVRAEQHRLRRQIPRSASPIEQRYQRLLARIGDLLVAWGSQLQTRFVTEGKPSPSMS